jgi:hypothetical protein
VSPIGDEASADRAAYLAPLREVEAERDRLRADLRDALQQVEHWRTLAEYRQATLLARQLEDAARRHQPQWIDYLLSDHEQTGAVTDG